MMMIAQHLRFLHCGSSSSMRRSSSSLPGTPLFSGSPASSLAFAWGCGGGGLRQWAQLDLITMWWWCQQRSSEGGSLDLI
jgi:hypothetical protein